MIQAVILAGGLGTRMRPFTETVPKPMLPVLGRPFLDHQIDLLRANGITRFLLLVSYLGHVIEEHFDQRKELDYEVAFSHEPSPLGTGGALDHAANLLDDEFLVCNGDTLLDIDYPALVRDFRSSGAQATVAAFQNLPEIVPSNLTVSADGRVLAYNKTHATGGFVDAGVVAAKKSVLRLIPPGEKCSFEQEVFPKLIEAGELAAWRTETPFFDMGTPYGLKMLEVYLRRREGD